MPAWIRKTGDVQTGWRDSRPPKQRLVLNWRWASANKCKGLQKFRICVLRQLWWSMRLYLQVYEQAYIYPAVQKIRKKSSTYKNSWSNKIYLEIGYIFTESLILFRLVRFHTEISHCKLILFPNSLVDNSRANSDTHALKLYTLLTNMCTYVCGICLVASGDLLCRRMNCVIINGEQHQNFIEVHSLANENDLAVDAIVFSVFVLIKS